MSFASLPTWLPWWVSILILTLLGLWALTMFLMPFSVIGLKSRLDSIELRLDEVQGEIRALVLRLPEPALERMSYRSGPLDHTSSIDQQYVQPATRPPIPPAPRAPDFIPRRPQETDPQAEPVRPVRHQELRADRPAPSPRAEPKLDFRR